MADNATPKIDPAYNRLYQEYVEARDLCTALTLQFGVGSPQSEDAEIKMRDLWHKLSELGGEPKQTQA
jgi:hypothetical protein